MVILCGDAVLAFNLIEKRKRIPGVLQEQLGPISYRVLLGDGRIWKRHVDHLRSRLIDET